MYNMSHQVAGQGRIGEIIPTMSLEVAPGDTWSGKVGLLTRLSPLNRALLHDIYVDQFMFYVPHRLVYADWENFIAAGPHDSPANPVAPPFVLPTKNIAAGENSAKHLWYNPAPTDSRSYSAFRLYAYNLIWNEYFRDEEFTAIAPSFANGPAVASAKRDYWSNLQAEFRKEESSAAPVNQPDMPTANVLASDILHAIALQKISMKRATYGTRYIDILKGYGIKVNYQMLQRPELVGMARGSINVTDVVSTSNATGSEGDLGSLAGHGIAGTRLRIKRKSFPEHGTLMSVLVLRPVHADNQFADWFDLPRAYESFYDPGLVPLPAVEVTRGDVAGPLDTDDQDATIGFQPWGDWYRKGMSRIHADMAEWTGDMLGGENGDTLQHVDLKQYNPANFNVLFQDTTFGHFQFSAVNKLKALRFLPRNNLNTVTGMGG